MTTRAKQLAALITTSDTVSVDPSTWTYYQNDKVTFKHDVVHGEIDVIILNLPHRIAFDLALITLPDPTSDVILHFNYYLVRADPRAVPSPLVNQYCDGMNTWSARTLECCVSWQVNDAIVHSQQMSEEYIAEYGEWVETAAPTESEAK